MTKLFLEFEGKTPCLHCIILELVKVWVNALPKETVTEETAVEIVSDLVSVLGEVVGTAMKPGQLDNGLAKIFVQLRSVTEEHYKNANREMN